MDVKYMLYGINNIRGEMCGYECDTVTRPKNKRAHTPSFYGPVVQLVRISACHAEGHEFESRLDRNYKLNTNKFG